MGSYGLMHYNIVLSVLSKAAINLALQKTHIWSEFGKPVTYYSALISNLTGWGMSDFSASCRGSYISHGINSQTCMWRNVSDVLLVQARMKSMINSRAPRIHRGAILQTFTPSTHQHTQYNVSHMNRNTLRLHEDLYTPLVPLSIWQRIRGLRLWCIPDKTVRHPQTHINMHRAHLLLWFPLWFPLPVPETVPVLTVCW